MSIDEDYTTVSPLFESTYTNTNALTNFIGSGLSFYM